MPSKANKKKMAAAKKAGLQAAEDVVAQPPVATEVEAVDATELAPHVASENAGGIASSSEPPIPTLSASVLNASVTSCFDFQNFPDLEIKGTRFPCSGSPIQSFFPGACHVLMDPQLPVNQPLVGSGPSSGEAPSPIVHPGLVLEDDFPSLNGSSSTSAVRSPPTDEFPALGPSVPPVKIGAWGKAVPTNSAPTSSSLPEAVVAIAKDAKDGKIQEGLAPLVSGFSSPKELKPLVESQLAKSITLITNSYSLDGIPNAKDVFHINVSVYRKLDEFESELKIIEGGRRNQADCWGLVKLALQKKDLENVVVGYDGAAVMYAVTQLEEEIILSTKDKTLKDFSKRHLRDKSGYVRIVLSPNNSVGCMKTSKICSEEPDSVHVRRLLTMFNVSMSQDARKAGFLVMEGGSQLYDVHNARVFQSGIDEADGVGASIKVAEGKNRTGQVQVVVDYKRVRFFHEGLLSDLMPMFAGRNGFDFQKAQAFLKGLQVKVIYNDHAFAIASVSTEPISRIRFNGIRLLNDVAKKTDKKVSDYRSDWPAIEARWYEKKQKRDRVLSYPAENLRVTGGQKLTPKHLGPPAAVPPKVRIVNSTRVAESAGILPTKTCKNSKMTIMGIAVNPSPIQVNGLQLALPTIAYRGGATTQPNLSKQASWSPEVVKGTKGGFVETKPVVAILIAYNSTDGGMNAGSKVRELAQQLTSNGKQLGVQIGKIDVEDLAVKFGEKDAKRAILAKLEQLGQLSTKPIFLYADHSDLPSHDALKLGERLYEVVTQHVTIDKAMKNLGKATVINLLMKMNVKNGGQNHHVVVDRSINHLWGAASTTLLFSYDVCHASGKKTYRAGNDCKEPSSVGFGYNSLKNPEKIVGDFHLQCPRQERVGRDILKQKMKAVLLQYHASRNSWPAKIIVIRDGVSAGQYNMVVRDEIPAIQEAVEEIWRERRVPKPKPGRAVIIATKRHSHRFHLSSSNGISNAPPLVVVDHTITRKGINEMIFLSHCPITGTAQPVLLNLLQNDNVFQSKEEIVKLVMALCCAHQPSNNIISIPETVYAADEYAKRGADLFSAFSELKPNEMVLEDGKVDFEAMTKKLNFSGSALFRGRRMT